MSTLGNLCGAGSAANIPVVLETLVRGLEAGSLVARCRCAEVRARCWTSAATAVLVYADSRAVRPHLLAHGPSDDTRLLCAVHSLRRVRKLIAAASASMSNVHSFDAASTAEACRCAGAVAAGAQRRRGARRAGDHAAADARRCAGRGAGPAAGALLVIFRVSNGLTIRPAQPVVPAALWHECRASGAAYSADTPVV